MNGAGTIGQLVRRTTAVRRTLVVLFALAAAGMVAVAVTRDDANVTWEWLTLLAVALATWLGARYAVGDVVEGRAERFDERELAFRHRATRVGFTVLWSAGFVVAVLLMTVGDGPPLAGRGGPLVFTVVLAGAAVPTLLLCWAAPEPDPEDD